jgi:nucleolar protein 4
VDKCAEVDGLTVLIHGFSASINKFILKSLLSSFVGVQQWSVTYPENKTPESRAHLSALFDNLENAQKLSFKFRNRSWKDMQLRSSIVGTDKGDVSSRLKEVIQKERKRAAQKMKIRSSMHEGGRVIVRNLHWRVDADRLKKMFQEGVGPVGDVQLPCKDDGTRRGFAFIQFDDKKHAKKAVEKFHNHVLKGRPMAVDLSVPRDMYQKAASEQDAASTTQSQPAASVASAGDTSQNSDNAVDLDDMSDTNGEDGNEGDEVNDVVAEEEEVTDVERNDFPTEEKEEEEDEELMKIGAPQEEDLCSDLEMPDDDNESVAPSIIAPSQAGKSGVAAKRPKYQSEDAKEGLTVFVKNLPFSLDRDDLLETFQAFGEVQLATVVMDKETGRPRGTGFVKFKDAESVKTCLEEVNGSVKGVVMDRRRLVAALAVSREESVQLTTVKKDQFAKLQDSRNLHLAREGLLRGDALQGCSNHDLALRTRVEESKKKKLVNSNIVISATRLCCHNLPKTVDAQQLRVSFMHAAGGRKNGANINECRVMRGEDKEGKKGFGLSLGFGFVNFSTHQHALRALRHLNNNPNIFNEAKRPIVEFSLENVKVLQMKETRLLNSRRKLNPEAEVVESLQLSHISRRKIKKQAGKTPLEPLVCLNQFSSYNSAAALKDAPNRALPAPAKHKFSEDQLKQRMRNPMPKKSSAASLAGMPRVSKKKDTKHSAVVKTKTKTSTQTTQKKNNTTKQTDRVDEIIARYMAKQT